MTKQIINCRVGTPVLRKYSNTNSEYIAYNDTRTVYIERSIDSLIETLTEIKNDYPEYANLELDAVSDCGCYHDCNCSPTYYVTGKRLETDLEYDFRIKKEQATKAFTEDRDRREYEKLKAKFG